MNRSEEAMVHIRSRDPVTVFEVIDDGGRTIGEVRQPCGEPVVGWGERTVYLRRETYRTPGAD